MHPKQANLLKKSIVLFCIAVMLLVGLAIYSGFDTVAYGFLGFTGGVALALFISAALDWIWPS